MLLDIPPVEVDVGPSSVNHQVDHPKVDTQKLAPMQCPPRRSTTLVDQLAHCCRSAALPRTPDHKVGTAQVRMGPHPTPIDTRPRCSHYFPSRQAYCLLHSLPVSLAPLPRSRAPPCTPCVEGRQRAAPHSSLFPPTTAPFQTLHLDVLGPSPVLGPHQERYFLIVVDDYSRYTTVFPLRRKADVPTVLKPWLLAWGGTQGLCGLRLHSDRGAKRHIGLVMEVARTSMCHAGDPQFLWPRALRYAAHLGSLVHVRAPGTNKLSLRTRACVFLGFPLDASGWVFYDPVTYQFFSSQDVTFDESVCYYRSCPHRGTEVFSPPLVLTLEPHPVVPVASPPSRPAPSGVLHVTLQSSPPQRRVLVVSGGAGGAVAEASSRRPRPASPPGFPSIPQFPPCSSLRTVAAKPRGVSAGGTGGPGGVSGGGAGSWGAGAGGTGTVAPSPRTIRFLTREQHLLRLEREERERSGVLAPPSLGQRRRLGRMYGSSSRPLTVGELLIRLRRAAGDRCGVGVDQGARQQLSGLGNGWAVDQEGQFDREVDGAVRRPD
ncbi:unnamed protein product [Closterium sp. NIES-53]